MHPGNRPLHAFVVGFVVYSALAKAGRRPRVIPEWQLTPPVSRIDAIVP
jgi:hypothetical protein